MTKVLVCYEDSWADEMDVCRYAVYSKKEAEDLEKRLEKIDCNIEYSVGTNQEIQYESGLELLECLTFQEVTNEELKVLEKFIDNLNTFKTYFLDDVCDGEDDD